MMPAAQGRDFEVVVCRKLHCRHNILRYIGRYDEAAWHADASKDVPAALRTRLIHVSPLAKGASVALCYFRMHRHTRLSCKELLADKVAACQVHIS